MSGGASQTVTLQQSGGVPTNRIATVNGISYGYDSAGDVTSDGVHSFSYDAESRIVKVDSGSTATYFYDSANRRVKKLAGAYTTYYVWEGSNVIAEYSNAPAGEGGTRLYHPDRLSNRMITDGSGVVKGTMDNLPSGEDGGVVGESEKHRFTTYERDSETGSDYAINRQHSNTTGRFMRPDPYTGSTYLTNPQTLNRYTYGWSDPVNKIDPFGLDSLVFDGCKLTRLDDNGKQVQSWDGVSGLPGTTSADQGNKGSGPLPEGSYTVDPKDTAYRFDQEFRIFNPAGPSGAWVNKHFWWSNSEQAGAAWGSYRTVLHPEPGTDLRGRDPNGFFVHGGDSPGSKGCIDLTGQNDAFHQFLRQYGKPIKLTIKLTCNPWKRSSNQPRGGGGGGGGFGFGGYPGWWYGMWDFLRWLYSIPVGGGGDGKEHLA